jgi:hypothetical protein
MCSMYHRSETHARRHSDTRDNGVIASVSVGAPRTFVMTPRLPAKVARIELSPSRRCDLEHRKPTKWL